MLQIFSKLLSDTSELSEEKISEIVDSFINAIPDTIIL
jgi:hypothetical protein